MKIRDTFILVKGNLNRTRLRTMLTIGGVIVSVGSIVLLVSLAFGLQSMTVSRIASINSLTRLTVTDQENTEQKINDVLIEKIKTDSEPDTFFLRRGRLKAIVSKSNGNTLRKMFILRTPAALADVKGTEFLTEVDDKENTSLACYEGKVSVSAQNVTVEVNAGFATFVEKGKPPMTPFLIPNAPKIAP